MAEEIEEKKLEFLKREEIRTMQRDIARLREAEAHKARERVAGLKTGEEEKAEKGKVERVKREARERKKMEEERKRKEEELKGKKEEARKEEEKKRKELLGKLARAKEEEEERKTAEEIKMRAKKRVQLKEDEKRREEERKREEQIRREEERKRKEEEKRRDEKRKRQEEERMKRLAKEREKETLTEREARIGKELEGISLKKKPLEEKKSKLHEDAKALRVPLETILQKEEEIETQKREIEERESKAVSMEERREVEQQRWQIEQERKETEVARWAAEEKIEKIEGEIRKVKSELQTLLQREKELEKEKEELAQKKQALELKEEKSRLLRRIIGLKKEKESVRSQREALLTEMKQIEGELEKCRKVEREIEEAIRTTEEEERLVTASKEKRRVEQERWKLEKDRQATEKKRMSLEKERANLEPRLKEIETEHAGIINKENRWRKRIEQIDQQLSLPAQGITEKEEEVARKVPEKTETEGIKEEKKVKPPEPETKPEVKERKTEGEERIEKVMAKKIRQEAEARERVEEGLRRRGVEAQNAIEEEKKTLAEEIEKKEKAEAPTVSRPTAQELLPVVEKPSFLEKVLVRAVVMMVLLLIIVGLFLLWRSGREKFPFQVPPTEKLGEELGFFLPLPLVAVEKTKIIEVSKIEEIPAAINLAMIEEINEGAFLQIFIKNTKENRLVSLAELADAFQVEAPGAIYPTLEEDFRLFIFSQKEGKRIALIAKIKDEEKLNELLKSWEDKIAKDGIYFLGKKIPTLVPSFETDTFQETSFRYLTVSKQDSGICYTALDGFFLLSGSFESLQTLIEKIKSLEEKAGQLFIVGIEETTLTPQLEQFFKKYKPGGILLLSKNIINKEQLQSLISDLQELSVKETGLPLFIAVDQEGGPISRIEFLSEKTSQSEIETAEKAFQVGKKRGEELKELGVNLNLAPLLDVMESGDFYFERTFQKSPPEIGELSKSLVLGQKKAGILTAIKHFPGYVGIIFNPEARLAVVKEIPEISQFKKAVEADPEFVMAANVVYKEIDPSLPFTFFPQAIQFLKNNLGNDLLIMSDDLAQTSLLEQFSLKEIVTRPVQAGVDVLIFSGWRAPVEEGLDAFFEAVENKEISNAKIVESVAKIIQLKESLK